MSQDGGGAADVDGIAWRVLSDLCRPEGEFATMAPEGLQQLIGLRLMEEARRAAVSPDVLAAAFARAMGELTGAGRPPGESGIEADGDPIETIDDLYDRSEKRDHG